MIKLENDVPVDFSIQRKVKSHRAKYPLDGMQIGQSFVETKTDEKTAAIMRATIWNWKKDKNPEAKFLTRKRKEGIRVWRIQ